MTQNERPPNERVGPSDEPAYVISVVARIVGLHAQTLRYYERAGVILPSRSQGRIRLYSERDIERLRLIRRLVEDLGVNLAGAEIIMNLTERLAEMEARLRELEAELEAYRDRTLPTVLSE